MQLGYQLELWAKFSETWNENLVHNMLIINKTKKTNAPEKYEM